MNRYCNDMNLMRVLLMFQDLLQLQYEGVAVIELFNDAKVNVNLLIFLLNKKFYSAGKWSIQDVQEFPKELENILAFSMCNKLLELVSNIIDLSQIVMLWHWGEGCSPPKTNMLRCIVTKDSQDWAPS